MTATKLPRPSKPRSTSWLPRLDLTYSMIRCYQTCPRKCFFSYVEQIESIRKSDALDVGSMFHAMIEKPGYITLVYPSEIPDAMMENYAKALVMAEAYHRELGADMAYTYMNRGTEQTFTIPLSTATGGRSRSYRLTGKIDGLVVDKKTGEYWLVEHKTAGQVDGAYLDKLALDLQIMIYVLAARTLWADQGVSPVGVIYNIVQKPTVRRLGITKTRLEPECIAAYASRMEQQYIDHPEWVSQHQIHFSNRTLSEVALELGMWADHITICRKTGLWPRQTGACHNNYGTCAFWPLCQGNMTDPELYIGTYYQRKDGMHSELNNNNNVDAVNTDINDIDNMVF